MGFFNDLFGVKEDPTKQLFKKIENFLNDEYSQNRLLPDKLRNLILQNKPCDIIFDEEEKKLHEKNGEGKSNHIPYEMQKELCFGTDSFSPIPVNGPIGEMIYLSNLTANGQRIFSHRIGSLNNGVDIYEIVTFDGSYWDILYLKPYYPSKSKKLPYLGGTKVGIIDRSLQSIYSVNNFVNGFPFGIDIEIRELTKKLLGIPLVHPDVKKVLNENNFVRTEIHKTNLHILENYNLNQDKNLFFDTDRIKEDIEKPLNKIDHLLDKIKGGSYLDPKNQHLSLNERKITEIINQIVTNSIFINGFKPLIKMDVVEKCGTGLFIYILSMAVNETLNQFSNDIDFNDGKIPSANAIKTNVIIKQHFDSLDPKKTNYEDPTIYDFLSKVDELAKSFLANDKGMHYKEVLIYRFECQFNQRNETNYLKGYMQHAKPEMSDNDFYAYILKLFIGLTNSK